MSTPIRYLTDEHVAKAVAEGLRRRGIEVLTLVEAGLRSAPDEDLWAFARKERRVLVTQDRDFLRMVAREQDHAGVVYAPQGRTIGEMVRMLDLLAQVSSVEEMQGRVEFL